MMNTGMTLRTLAGVLPVILTLAIVTTVSAQESEIEPRGQRFIDPPDLSMLEDMRVHFDHPMVESIERRVRRSVEEHREVARLERESRELAREARRAEGQERSELEAQLREKLNEIFDKKLEVRRERIERLHERLEEERSNLQERTEARDEMIDRRHRSLLGESDALEW